MTPPSPPLCDAALSQLLVVDIQERLAAVMDPSVRARVEGNTRTLIAAATLLRLPTLVSEQYPRGLGPTVSEVAATLSESTPVIEKSCFACGTAPGFLEQLAAVPRPQLIVSGMESHICVLQTALDLQARGYQPFVVEDAVCSRSKANHRNAMARLRQAGIVVTTTESVIFEWLRDASHSHFKQLSALIK